MPRAKGADYEKMKANREKWAPGGTQSQTFDERLEEAKDKNKLDASLFLLMKEKDEKKRAGLTGAMSKQFDKSSFKEGGEVGAPIKTYSNGGYIEGK